MRNRNIEIISMGLTVILLAITILTYLLDQSKSNWVCGPVLFLFELISIGVQTVFLFLIWNINNKHTKRVILTLTIGLLVIVIFGFVSFNLNCS